MTAASEPASPSGGEPREGTLPPLPAGVVVPDDARALEGDRSAWLQLQRRGERHRRWDRRWRAVLLTRRWERYGLSGPLVVAVLVLVALLGAMVTVLGPSHPDRPASAPLAPGGAATAQGAAGGEGSLLPDLELRTATSTRSLRDARPAVLALVPAGCDCQAAVDAAFAQAAEFRLRMWLLAPPGGLLDVRRLSADVGNGSATPVEDTGGTLRGAYAARGLTLLLVHADGVVRRVVRDATAAVRLEGDLTTLDQAAGEG
jgi:hypothetical protein